MEYDARTFFRVIDLEIADRLRQEFESVLLCSISSWSFFASDTELISGT